VFENRVLRRMFGPKGDERIGDRRRLHNEEPHNLYSFPNIIKMVKLRWIIWTGHVVCMGAKQNMCRVLEGKLEERRLLGRSRCRWEDNIKMGMQ
jgi:hypothetical protein